MNSNLRNAWFPMPSNASEDRMSRMENELRGLRNEVFELRTSLHSALDSLGCTNVQFAEKIAAVEAAIKQIQMAAISQNQVPQMQVQMQAPNSNSPLAAAAGDVDWRLVARNRGGGGGGRAAGGGGGRAAGGGGGENGCAVDMPGGGGRPGSSGVERESESIGNRWRSGGRPSGGFREDGVYGGGSRPRTVYQNNGARDRKVKWYSLPAHKEGDAAYNAFRAEVRAIEERGVVVPPNALCRLERKSGDLMKADAPFKAHAVAADLGMLRGFARHYRNCFGRPEVPDGTGPLAPGHVVAANVRNEKLPKSTFLNVVTKVHSSDRLQDKMGDFVKDVEAGVKGLAAFCAEAKWSTLAMTNICSGLDGMPHKWMEQLIINAFASQDIKITIFHRPGRLQQPWQQQRREQHPGPEQRLRPEEQVQRGGIYVFQGHQNMVPPMTPRTPPPPGTYTPDAQPSTSSSSNAEQPNFV